MISRRPLIQIERQFAGLATVPLSEALVLHGILFDVLAEEVRSPYLSRRSGKKNDINFDRSKTKQTPIYLNTRSTEHYNVYILFEKLTDILTLTSSARLKSTRIVGWCKPESMFDIMYTSGSLLDLRDFCAGDSSDECQVGHCSCFLVRPKRSLSPWEKPQWENPWSTNVKLNSINAQLPDWNQACLIPWSTVGT